ncbi:MAG: hypothetical protein GY861_18495 [bacterium]|nr:hypothetical protein [bacterium]
MNKEEILKKIKGHPKFFEIYKEEESWEKGQDVGNAKTYTMMVLFQKEDNVVDAIDVRLIERGDEFFFLGKTPEELLGENLKHKIQEASPCPVFFGMESEDAIGVTLYKPEGDMVKAVQSLAVEEDGDIKFYEILENL